MPRVMPKHHVVISGTGRAGTTFLVQLLTRLGLPTGFADSSDGLFGNCSAGMEWDIGAGAPYIIKSPRLCEYLDEALAQGTVVVDHAFVPMRSLYSAAESRRDVSRRSAVEFPVGAPGGVWRTADPARQEDVLALQLYKLMFTLAKWNVPTTLLHFPRFVHDAAYLYDKLGPLLGATRREDFAAAFAKTAQPQLVHAFSADDVYPAGG